MCTILSLPKITLDRYDVNVAEHVLKLAELAATAEDLFENPEDLSVWLRAPARALGGRQPLPLFTSFTGIEIVTRVIGGLPMGSSNRGRS